MTEELELQMQETIDLVALIGDDLDPESWESVEHAARVCDAAVLRSLRWGYPARPASGRISELRSIVLTIARSVHAAANLVDAKNRAEWYRDQLANGTIRPDVHITPNPDGTVTTFACGEFVGQPIHDAGDEPTELDLEMAGVISLLPLISKFVMRPEQVAPHRLAIEQLSRVLAYCPEVSQS